MEISNQLDYDCDKDISNENDLIKVNEVKDKVKKPLDNN